MEENPPTQDSRPSDGREAPRPRTQQAAFSAPEPAAPKAKPADRTPRRADATKAAPAVTFQPPPGEGDAEASKPQSARGRTPRKQKPKASAGTPTPPSTKAATPGQRRAAQPAATRPTEPPSPAQPVGTAPAAPKPAGPESAAAPLPDAPERAAAPKPDAPERAAAPRPAGPERTTAPQATGTSETVGRRSGAHRVTPDQQPAATAQPAGPEADRTGEALQPPAAGDAGPAAPSDGGPPAAGRAQRKAPAKKATPRKSAMAARTEITPAKAFPKPGTSAHEADPAAAKPQPATPAPATTEPATSGVATSGVATSEPATSEPATSGPATSGPATSETASAGPGRVEPAKRAARKATRLPAVPVEPVEAEVTPSQASTTPAVTAESPTTRADAVDAEAKAAGAQSIEARTSGSEASPDHAPANAAPERAAPESEGAAPERAAPESEVAAPESVHAAPEPAAPQPPAAPEPEDELLGDAAPGTLELPDIAAGGTGTRGTGAAPAESSTAAVIPTQPSRTEAAEARATLPEAEPAEAAGSRAQLRADAPLPSAGAAPTGRPEGAGRRIEVPAELISVVEATRNAARVAVPTAWSRIVADPGHTPELLALAAVQLIGPRAADWARDARESYPSADQDGIARLAIQQFSRRAGIANALASVAGSYAPVALLGATGWTHAELVLHVAAAYGQDPADLTRAADLLVLTRVHPTHEDAETAIATTMEPAAKGASGAGDAVWRLGRMAANQAAGWLALRAVSRFFPGTTVLVTALMSRSGAENLGIRATAYYRAAAQRATARSSGTA